MRNSSVVCLSGNEWVVLVLYRTYGAGMGRARALFSPLFDVTTIKGHRNRATLQGSPGDRWKPHGLSCGQ